MPLYLAEIDVPRLTWRLNGVLVACWLEGDMAYQDVWVHDHATGVMTRLTTDGGRKQEMEASGDRIVWLSDPVNEDGEDRQLFLASRVHLFSDVSLDGPFGTAIYLEGEGVISGYETADGGWEFRPDDSVLRAQFAKMMCGAMGMWMNEEDWQDASPPFGDVGTDQQEALYPHEYIAVAAREGITRGTRSGSYPPWAPISRAQVVTMAVRAVQKAAPRLLATPPSWHGGSLGAFDPTHADTMRTAEHNDLLAGLEDYRYGWDPWQEASRAETAQILWNVLVRLAPAGGGEFIMAGEKHEMGRSRPPGE